jgi:N6-adenosine-specific RNA methylase IME4
MKKYKTLLIDPPWPYNRQWNKGSEAAICQADDQPMPYNQMRVGDIAALPINNLMAENCDVYLWATQKYLPDAFNVLSIWGLKYCQTLTWCKTPRGLGQGGLYCPTSEFLILARKGRMPVGKRRQDSTWWNITRTQAHSQKPDFFHELIEGQSDGPRLELFARRSQDGWDVWGDEAPESIEWVTIPTGTIGTMTGG